MALNTAPIYVAAPFTGIQTFENADGTAKKTIITPGANGFRLDSLHCCLDDTAAATVNFYATVGGTDYFIGQVAVASGAGVSNAWVEALTTLNTNMSMVFGNVVTAIKASVATAVSTGKTLTIMALGGNF
jgi:hypothetical protein